MTVVHTIVIRSDVGRCRSSCLLVSMFSMTMLMFVLLNLWVVDCGSSSTIVRVSTTTSRPASQQTGSKSIMYDRLNDTTASTTTKRSDMYKGDNDHESLTKEHFSIFEGPLYNDSNIARGNDPQQLILSIHSRQRRLQTTGSPAKRPMDSVKSPILRPTVTVKNPIRPSLSTPKSFQNNEGNEASLLSSAVHSSNLEEHKDSNSSSVASNLKQTVEENILQDTNSANKATKTTTPSAPPVLNPKPFAPFSFVAPTTEVQPTVANTSKATDTQPVGITADHEDEKSNQRPTNATSSNSTSSTQSSMSSIDVPTSAVNSTSRNSSGEFSPFKLIPFTVEGTFEIAKITSRNQSTSLNNGMNSSETLSKLPDLLRMTLQEYTAYSMKFEFVSDCAVLFIDYDRVVGSTAKNTSMITVDDRNDFVRKRQRILQDVVSISYKYEGEAMIESPIDLTTDILEIVHNEQYRVLSNRSALMAYLRTNPLFDGLNLFSVSFDTNIVPSPSRPEVTPASSPFSSVASGSGRNDTANSNDSRVGSSGISFIVIGSALSLTVIGLFLARRRRYRDDTIPYTAANDESLIDKKRASISMSDDDFQEYEKGSTDPTSLRGKTIGGQDSGLQLVNTLSSMYNPYGSSQDDICMCDSEEPITFNPLFPSMDDGTNRIIQQSNIHDADGSRPSAIESSVVRKGSNEIYSQHLKEFEQQFGQSNIEENDADTGPNDEDDDSTPGIVHKMYIFRPSSTGATPEDIAETSADEDTRSRHGSINSIKKPLLSLRERSDDQGFDDAVADDQPIIPPGSKFSEACEAVSPNKPNDLNNIHVGNSLDTVCGGVAIQRRSTDPSGAYIDQSDDEIKPMSSHLLGSASQPLPSPSTSAADSSLRIVGLVGETKSLGRTTSEGDDNSELDAGSNSSRRKSPSVPVLQQQHKRSNIKNVLIDAIESFYNPRRNMDGNIPTVPSRGLPVPASSDNDSDKASAAGSEDDDNSVDALYKLAMNPGAVALLERQNVKQIYSKKQTVSTSRGQYGLAKEIHLASTANLVVDNRITTGFSAATHHIKNTANNMPHGNTMSPRHDTLYFHTPTSNEVQVTRRNGSPGEGQSPTMQSSYRKDFEHGDESTLGPIALYDSSSSDDDSTYSSNSSTTSNGSSEDACSTDDNNIKDGNADDEDIQRIIQRLKADNEASSVADDDEDVLFHGKTNSASIKPTVSVDGDEQPPQLTPTPLLRFAKHSPRVLLDHDDAIRRAALGSPYNDIDPIIVGHRRNLDDSPFDEDVDNNANAKIRNDVYDLTVLSSISEPCNSLSISDPIRKGLLAGPTGSNGRMNNSFASSNGLESEHELNHKSVHNIVELPMTSTGGGKVPLLEKIAARRRERSLSLDSQSTSNSLQATDHLATSTINQRRGRSKDKNIFLNSSNTMQINTRSDSRENVVGYQADNNAAALKLDTVRRRHRRRSCLSSVITPNRMVRSIPLRCKSVDRSYYGNALKDIIRFDGEEKKLLSSPNNEKHLK